MIPNGVRAGAVFVAGANPVAVLKRAEIAAMIANCVFILVLNNPKAVRCLSGI